MPTDVNADPEPPKSVKAGFAFAAAVAFVGLINIYDSGLPSGVDYLVMGLGFAVYYGGVVKRSKGVRIAGWVAVLAGVAIGLFGAAT